MQKFALTVFKAFPFAVLYQTARPCTARIPAKPDNIQHPRPERIHTSQDS